MKKLPLCLLVLASRALHRLPDGRSLKSFSAGCERLAEMSPASPLILDQYRSWTEGRPALIILSADRIVLCSLCLPCFVADPNQTVMDLQRTDLMTAV